MRTHITTTRSSRRASLGARAMLVSLVTGLLVAVGGTVSLGSSAAAGDWVDGGDDLPCVDDVTCEWIEGCYLDDNGNPVYPGQEPKPTPTPKPSPKPTPKPSPKPTPAADDTGSKGDKGSKGTSGDKGSTGSKGSSGSQGGSPGSTTTEDSAAQGTDPVVDETTEEAETENDADNPYADRLAPPRLTVDGTDVTVTWEAVDQEGFEVQEYVVELNGAEPATVDADTTSHTFTDVAAGKHRSIVTAVAIDGEELKSFKSQNAVVGDTSTDAVPSVEVTGDLEPGGVITIAGRGLEARATDLVVEIHSEPRELATVDTTRRGRFQVEVTVPEDLPAGDHTIVVLDEGTEVAALPVTVTGGAGAGGADVAASSVAGDWSRGGLLLLLGLAGSGALALLWHGATARRRRRPLVSTISVTEPVSEVLTAH
jgi:hypothetical protein